MQKTKWPSRKLKRSRARKFSESVTKNCSRQVLVYRHSLLPILPFFGNNSQKNGYQNVNKLIGLRGDFLVYRILKKMLAFFFRPLGNQKIIILINFQQIHKYIKILLLKLTLQPVKTLDI